MMEFEIVMLLKEEQFHPLVIRKHDDTCSSLEMDTYTALDLKAGAGGARGVYGARNKSL